MHRVLAVGTAVRIRVWEARLVGSPFMTYQREGGAWLGDLDESLSRSESLTDFVGGEGSECNNWWCSEGLSRSKSLREGSEYKD
jgi:hypothetical protein